jgi:hypothetical protein
MAMISKSLYHLSILIFILGKCSLFGQESDFIKGQLLDAQTGEPLVFATIRIKGKAKGVISNQDGGFRIPKKFKDLGDVLIISSMGYEKHEIPINAFSLDDITIISLQPGVMVLIEAVVSAKIKRKLSARSIVRKAIKAIPENFPNDPFSTIGYYRDYQLQKNEYINLNEAILEVFDEGFDTFDFGTTKVKIYDYKENTDFKRNLLADDQYNYKNWKKVIDKAYLFNYGGNEFIILRVHDAIRNYRVDSYDFVNRFDTDLLINHQFSKGENVFLDDEVLYVISFRKTLDGYSMYGELYISKRDFALHKMEYALYDNRKRSISGELNKHNNKSQLIFEVISEYKRKQDKMYLNYIFFKNTFQLGRSPEFIVNEVTLNKSMKCFEVIFNKEVDPANAFEKKNYDFKYKGEKIEFDKVQVLNESVRLYPEMKQRELNELFAEIEIASRKRLDIMELLSAEISGLVDIYGNHINKKTFKDYQQFREFFIQEVVPNNSAPKDGLFMKKNRPIFKDQPIVKPDNFKDYWMNTPLQNSKQ